MASNQWNVKQFGHVDQRSDSMTIATSDNPGCCSQGLEISMNKTVRFQEDRNQEFYVDRRHDLLEEEIRAIWFDESDFKAINEETDATVKLLKAGLTDPERAGFCFRGLEQQSPFLSRHRLNDIDRSIKAVVKMQNRLKSQGIAETDLDDSIAKHYQSITKQFQVDAHRIGLWDARVAHLLWRIRTDECPKVPRRKWAKAG